MSASADRAVINDIVSRPPAPGRRITAIRLDGSRSLDLTELYEAAGRLALRLRAEGIGPGDRIGILAGNSLEWVVVDLAALRLKAVTAGFEPGKFEPGPALIERYALKALFTDRPIGGAGIRAMSEVTTLLARYGPDAGVVAGAAVANDGAGRETVPEDARVRDVDEPLPPPVHYAPDDVSTIKFTSGSTGEPKGLAQTVGCTDGTINAVQEIFEHGPDDDLFLFLPLSLLQQRYWIYSALCFGHHITLSTYEAAFVSLPRAQPTVVMGVPAFFEAAMKHIEGRAARALERSAAANGEEHGQEHGQEHDAGSAGGDGAARRREEALRDAARALFGPRIRYLWTGSAPARPAMLRFFTGAGLPIYEGYGLNEACIVAKNHPGAHREGSVGRLLRGKHVVFDEDGVISIRSDHPVNLRYEYAAPGDNERVFGPGGVVRTGDIGYLDHDGFLFIRGRADDVIVLDNGRKVIVRPLEEFMKASPAVDECVVFCPSQTHLAAVVSPAAQPADEAAILARLAEANASFGADEQIKRLIVADAPFSTANGLLGSQFKPRRGEIFEIYRSRLDAR